MSDPAERTDSPFPPPPPPPQLPPPQTATARDAPAPDVPYLPAARLPAPSYTAEPGADIEATETVQATTRVNVNPTYGVLPVANAETRAAAELLREQARKKRRHNSAVGWGVVAALVGVIGAAGWFAYAAYQKDQDQQAADREAAQERDPAEILDTLEEVSGSDAPSAADDAPGGGDLTVPTPPTEPPGEPAPAVAAVPMGIPFEDIGLSQFTYRRYEGATIDSPNNSYTFLYDTTADEYACLMVSSSDEGSGRIYSTVSDGWQSWSNVEGELIRFARSAASADPGPDVPQAALLNELVLLPNDARSFATITDVGTVIAGRSSDSDITYEVQAYLLDVDAFRTSHPESYAAWMTTWTAPGPDDPSFYDHTTAQVSPNVLVGLDLDEFEAPSFFFAKGEPELSDRALIAYALADDGFVNLALIVDPVGNFRAEYILNDPPGLTADTFIRQLDSLEWVDE